MSAQRKPIGDGDRRARWSPATRVEAELVLVMREGRLTRSEIRLLALLYNDVRARPDFTKFFPFDTVTYGRVLGLTRQTLGEVLHHLAELGWVELGPRTSRHRTVRLKRLAGG